MYLLNQITQAILQLILFSLLPLLTYSISRRRLKGFLSYIGLKAERITNWKNVIAGFLLSFVILFLGMIIMNSAGAYGDSADLRIQEIGSAGFIFSLLIHSFIRTGLSEEILFRGFIAKRLIPRIGFLYGNLIQAVLFGMPHFLFLDGVSWHIGILQVVRSAIAGFIFCYVNEKEAGGSLLPSWIFHGVINAVNSIVILSLQ